MSGSADSAPVGRSRLTSGGRRTGRRSTVTPDRATLLEWVRLLGGGTVIGQKSRRTRSTEAAAVARLGERYQRLRTSLLWTEHRARMAALHQEARLRAEEHAARLAVLRQLGRRLSAAPAESAEVELLRRDAERREEEHRVKMALLRQVKRQVTAAEGGHGGVQELVSLLQYL